MMRVLDLFSGIGGFSLGLESTGGFETVAFCEIDPFCRQVLAKHWPGVPIYEDVRTLDASTLQRDGITVDAICGGFPCQDISTAGKLAGIEAAQSGLWFEYLRIIGELRPSVVIVENVANLLSGPSEQPGEWFRIVLGGLAQIRYDAVWDCLPAATIGAPHIRDRIWIIAQPEHPHSDDAGPHQPRRDLRPTELRNRQSRHAGALRSDVADADCARLQVRPIDAGVACGQDGRDAWKAAAFCGWWDIEPALGRVADGVPGRVDRLRALGNAVVPQIPALIGRAILQAHVLKAEQHDTVSAGDEK